MDSCRRSYGNWCIAFQIPQGHRLLYTKQQSHAAFASFTHLTIPLVDVSVWCKAISRTLLWQNLARKLLGTVDIVLDTEHRREGLPCWCIFSSSLFAGGAHQSSLTDEGQSLDRNFVPVCGDLRCILVRHFLPEEVQGAANAELNCLFPSCAERHINCFLVFALIRQTHSVLSSWKSKVQFSRIIGDSCTAAVHMHNHTGQ
jgi:hypothetical protein